MGIQDPEIVDLVQKIEELESKLFAHPLHKVGILGSIASPVDSGHIAHHLIMIFFIVQSGQTEQQFKWFQRKAEVNHEIQQLKSKMRDSQVMMVTGVV